MRRIALRLRTKLLLASGLLLALPYAAFQSVNEMERYLREGLDQTLVGTAQALASALHERRSLLQGSDKPDADIFVHSVPGPIQLDGYLQDWGPLATQAQTVGSGAGFGFSFVAAQREGYLYLLLRVRDDRVVYRSPQSPAGGNADHIELLTRFASQRVNRYVIDTSAPGWVLGTEVEPHARQLTPIRRAYPIKGEWRGVDDGYVVELRMPLELLGPELAIRAVDYDGPDLAPGLLATDARLEGGRYGRLLTASTEMEALISSLGRTPGRRIRVVDRDGRVRASGGSLSRPDDDRPVSDFSIYRWVLSPPVYRPGADAGRRGALRGPAVVAALGGTEGTEWRRHGEVVVVSAAAPIRADDDVIGAVLVEETTVPIQTVRRRALAGLFGATIVSALLAAVVLLLLATRVVVRIQRLRDQADRAIDRHGRVVGSIEPTPAGDEIGDLSRSFAGLLTRLHRYNDYLERLASRLSHELRTPTAVVRSSLENLSQAPPGDQSVYVERAMAGVQRLSAILSRMSEATRIEQSIERAELEDVELAGLIASTLQGYRQTWPRRTFASELSADPARIRGVPDLLAQLLDKLIANAIDFGDPASPIVIRLAVHGDGYRVEVENAGSTIERASADSLFDSLVSERPGATEPDEPHLGLGLYIARLIVELHGGTISARNVDTARGRRVVFGVELPGHREA